MLREKCCCKKNMYLKPVVTKCAYCDVHECGIVRKKVSVTVAPSIPTKWMHYNGQKIEIYFLFLNTYLLITLIQQWLLSTVGSLLNATSQGLGCHAILPYVIVPLLCVCWFHAGFKGVCLGMLEPMYLSVSVTQWLSLVAVIMQQWQNDIHLNIVDWLRIPGILCIMLWFELLD